MKKQTIYIIAGTLIIAALLYYFFSGSEQVPDKYKVKKVSETEYDGQTIKTQTAAGLEPGKKVQFYDGDGNKTVKGKIKDVNKKPDKDFSTARIAVDKEPAKESSYFKVV